MKRVISYLSFLILLLPSCNPNDHNNHFFEADVVVYGGTSAAVIAAVEVAQSGKSVILVSPDLHLGGLTAGGLGWTDTGKKRLLEVFQEIFTIGYGNTIIKMKHGFGKSKRIMEIEVRGQKQ